VSETFLVSHASIVVQGLTRSLPRFRLAAAASSYRENKTYYPATVVDVGQVGDKSDFRVAYDEGEGQLCHVKNMRRLTLKPGDVVYNDEIRYVVQQQAFREEGLESDAILLLKPADAAPNTKPKRIKVRDIVRPKGSARHCPFPLPPAGLS
jgi:hypothetical protein